MVTKTMGKINKFLKTKHFVVLLGFLVWKTLVLKTVTFGGRAVEPKTHLCVLEISLDMGDFAFVILNYILNYTKQLPLVEYLLTCLTLTQSQ